jgi:hypothetical protein
MVLMVFIGISCTLWNGLSRSLFHLGITEPILATCHFCLVVLDSTRACSKAQSVLWFTALPCPPPPHPPLVGRTSGTGSTKSGASTRWLPAHIGRKPQKAPEHDTETGYILWNEPIGPVPPGQVIILSSWRQWVLSGFCSKR